MVWDFSWFTDPTAWIGLGTLIILEVVLGIDNLLFISILAAKLPPHQKDKAFRLGLLLALLMRLGLLAGIVWIVTLTRPVFTVWAHPFSARDLILIVGGLFLLFKATMELHERLEGGHIGGNERAVKAVFWQVVTQIVVLDAIFSLDSVITSVGMVQHLPVMMLAVIIAVAVMLLASRPLTRFVEKHPTVIVLCLGFLLMIGLSLIMDGLGFHIPKGYLYAAISFSVLVELFNQIALRKRQHRITTRDLREYTAGAVLRLLGGGNAEPSGEEQLEVAALASGGNGHGLFAPEERTMVARVIRLGGRTTRYIMTPRHRVAWLNSELPEEELLRDAGTASHAWLPLCRGDLDTFLGIVSPRELLWQQRQTGSLHLETLLHEALIVFEHTPLTELLETFRRHRMPSALVLDEYGGVAGIVTPLDILAAIAGHMYEVSSDPASFRRPDGSWFLPGRLAIDDALRFLDARPPAGMSSTTLAGFILERLGRIPRAGDGLDWKGWRFEVAAMDRKRIESVHVRRLPPTAEMKNAT